MKSDDPGRLTAAERLAEIAEVLAAGYQRLVVKECKPPIGQKIPQEPLDESAPSEASCGSKAMNPRSQDPAA